MIQEREFGAVGDSEPVKVDVRMISATNKDLVAMVKAQTFREDLYYRINIFPIQVPPLRERREDIPALAFHFLNAFSRELGRKATGFSDGAMSLLTGHAWPGNVRELENCIERTATMVQGDAIRDFAFACTMLPPPMIAIGPLMVVVVIVASAVRRKLVGPGPDSADRSCARPEQCRPHTDDRRAFGHGRLEVVAHAHGERVELVPIRVEAFEQLAQPAERLALGDRVGGSTRQAHQAAQPEPRQRGDHRREGAGVVGGDAALVGLVVEPDLQQDLQRPGMVRALRAQPCGHAFTVEGVHPREALGNLAGLVGLEPTDVVPPGFGEVRQPVDLGGAFLGVALAEVAQSGRIGLAHLCRGLLLAHREQADRRRVPSGRGGGPLDPGAYRLQRGG